MKTIDRLKKKRAKLIAALDQVEIEIAALSTMTQVLIPGLPAPPSQPAKQRQPSIYEEHHAEFLATRLERLKRIGVEPVPDEPQQPAFVNTRMRTMLEACGGDPELLWAVFTAFVNDSWAAGLTPPYPFRALASAKVFGSMLDQVKARTT